MRRKKIAVCTIQPRPYVLKRIGELTAAQGKRFTVIAGETHSSQTGEAAAKLKAVRLQIFVTYCGGQSKIRGDSCVGCACFLL